MSSIPCESGLAGLLTFDPLIFQCEECCGAAGIFSVYYTLQRKLSAHAMQLRTLVVLVGAVEAECTLRGSVVPA